MSTYIDERVVEMQFDNEDFEKNTKTTLKTIDKLKEALDFGKSGKDSASGLDAIAIASTNMGNTIKASTVIAITALSRLTNAAINAGEKIVKSLTVDQISAGWDKLVEKTSSVQTIFNATKNGIEGMEALEHHMEVVTGQIEELNWFTDETSFNLVDMTSNIAKFTSAGVELESATQAMMGIASAAGYAGLNAGSASHAMEGFSKSMASGYMNRQNWSWIKTAGMDTLAFKQQLIDAAVEAGSLVKVQKKVGKGKTAKIEEVYAVTSTTKKGKLTKKSHEVTAENFEEYLSDKWLTAEAIENTLNQYGQFATEAYKALDAIDANLWTSDLLGFIDLYKEKGMTELKAALEEAGIVGKQQEDLITNIKRWSGNDYKLSVEAFKASQEAKSLQEAIDSWKDAASTQWMSAFETIIGDYLKAKTIWTALANWGYEVFVSPLAEINSILDRWEENGGRDFLFLSKEDAEENEEIAGAFYLLGDAISSIFAPTHKALGELFPLLKIFDGSAMPEDIKYFGDQLTRATESFRDFIASLSLDEDGELYSLIYDAVYSLGSAFKLLKESIGEALKTIWGTGLIQSFFSLIVSVTSWFGNLVTSFIKFLQSNEHVTKAWKGIVTVFRNLAKVLKNLTGIFKKNTAKDALLGLGLSESNIDKLSKSIKELWSSLKDLWKVVKEGVSAAGNKLWDWITKIYPKMKDVKTPLEAISVASEDLFNVISEFLAWGAEKVNKFWKENGGGIRTFAKSLVQSVKDMWKGVQDKWPQIEELFNQAWEWFKGTSLGQTILGIWTDIQEAFITLWTGVTKEGKTLEQAFDEAFGDVRGAITTKLNEIVTELQNAWDMIQKQDWLLILGALTIVAGVLAALFYSYKTLQAVIAGSSINGEIAMLVNSFRKTMNIFSRVSIIFAFVKCVESILNAFEMISELLDKGKLVESIHVFVIVLAAIAGFIYALKKIASGGEGSSMALFSVAAVLVGVALSLWAIERSITFLQSMDWGPFLDGLAKVASTIVTVLGSISTIAWALSKFSGEATNIGSMFKGFGKSLLGVAVGILILVAVIRYLSTVQIGTLLGGFGALIAIMTVLVKSVTKIADSVDTNRDTSLVKAGVLILMIAAALKFMIVPAVIALGNLDIGTFLKAMGALIIIGGIIAGIVWLALKALNKITNGEAQVAKQERKLLNEQKKETATVQETIKMFRAKALMILSIGAAVFLVAMAIERVVNAASTADKFTGKGMTVMWIFVGVIAAFIGAIIALTAIAKDSTSGVSTKIYGVALLVAAMAAAFYLIAQAIAKMLFVSGDVIKHPGLTIVMVGALAALTYLMIKQAQKIVQAASWSSSSMWQAGILVGAVAALILAAAYAIKTVVKATSVAKGASLGALAIFGASIIGMLWATSLIVKETAKLPKGGASIWESAIVIAALAVGCIALAHAFSVMSSAISMADNANLSLAAFGGMLLIVLLGVALIVKAASKVTNGWTLLGAALVIAVVAASIYFLVKAIQDLISVDTGNLDVDKLKEVLKIVGIVAAIAVGLLTVIAIVSALTGGAGGTIFGIAAGVVVGLAVAIWLVCDAAAGLIDSFIGLANNGDNAADSLQKVYDVLKQDKVLETLRNFAWSMVLVAAASAIMGGNIYSLYVLYEMIGLLAGVVTTFNENCESIVTNLESFFDYASKVGENGEANSFVNFFDNLGKSLQTLSGHIDLLDSIEIAKIAGPIKTLSEALSGFMSIASGDNATDISKSQTVATIIGNIVRALKTYDLTGINVSNYDIASALQAIAYTVEYFAEHGVEDVPDVNGAIDSVRATLVNLLKDVDADKLVAVNGQLEEFLKTMIYGGGIGSGAKTKVGYAETVGNAIDSFVDILNFANELEVAMDDGGNIYSALHTQMEAIGDALVVFSKKYMEAATYISKAPIDSDTVKNAMIAVGAALQELGYTVGATELGWKEALAMGFGKGASEDVAGVVNNALTFMAGPNGFLSAAKDYTGSLLGVGGQQSEISKVAEEGADMVAETMEDVAGEMWSSAQEKFEEAKDKYLSGNGAGLLGGFESIIKLFGGDSISYSGNKVVIGFGGKDVELDLGEVVAADGSINTDGLMSQLMSVIPEEYQKYIPQIQSALSGTGELTWGSLMAGIQQGDSDASTGSTAIISYMLGQLVEKANSYGLPAVFTGLGENAAIGLAQGLISDASLRSVSSAASILAKTASTAASEALDINSPSRVMAQIGNFAGLGFANGIVDTFSVIKSASTGMADTAIEALNLASNGITDSLNGDMNPVIRPIIDLTDIQAGSEKMKSMMGLDTYDSYKYAAKASYARNGYSEDGTNINNGTTVNITVTQPTEAWTEYLFNKFNVRFAGVI